MTKPERELLAAMDLAAALFAKHGWVLVLVGPHVRSPKGAWSALFQGQLSSRDVHLGKFSEGRTAAQAIRKAAKAALR